MKMNREEEAEEAAADKSADKKEAAAPTPKAVRAQSGMKTTVEAIPEVVGPVHTCAGCKKEITGKDYTYYPPDIYVHNTCVHEAPA